MFFIDMQLMYLYTSQYTKQIRIKKKGDTMNKRIVAYSLTLLAIVWLTVFVNSAIAEIDIPETVLIQPGNFMMGMDVTSDTLGVDGYTGATEFKEAPAHQVTLTRSYAMGKYEITNQQFADFVDAGGYNKLALLDY